MICKNIVEALQQADIIGKTRHRMSSKEEIQCIIKNKTKLEWNDFVQISKIKCEYPIEKYSLALLIVCLENNLYNGKYKEKLYNDLQHLKECLDNYLWAYANIFANNYNEIQFISTALKYNITLLRVLQIKPGNPVFMDVFKLYLQSNYGKFKPFEKVFKTFVISIGNKTLNSYKDINDTVFWTQINFYKEKYKSNTEMQDIAFKSVCHFYRWLIAYYSEYDFFKDSLTLTNELVQNNALVRNIKKDAYFTTYGINEDLGDKPVICFILKNYNNYSTRVSKISHATLDSSKVNNSYYRTLINKYVQNSKSVTIISSKGNLYTVYECLHFIEQLKKEKEYPNKDIKKLNTQEAILIRNFVINASSNSTLPTLNNNIGSIRRFLSWCKENNYIKFNEIFFDYLSQIEEPNSYHGKTISDDDIKKISNQFIALCKKDESELIYYAIFIILLETEFRISQVCSLTTSSLQPSLKKDQFYLYSNTKTSNGKKVQQPICLSTKSILSKVIELTEPLRNETIQNSAKDLIFLSRHYNGSVTPLKAARFREKLKEVCSAAGVKEYNTRNLRDTHMTKAFEFILKSGKSDLEMGLLSRHSVIDTTKHHYIEIELTKMLESIYQVTLGDRDVTQQSHIVNKLPAEIANKDTEVENGCGHCSAPECNIAGNTSCLMCKHFVTTPNHKPYFIKMISNCDKLLSQAIISHEKEDLTLIKTLYTSWLREICIVEEQKK